MSRTYRKSSITAEKSLVQYVNRQLGYLNRRAYHYEYYLTSEGQRAYGRAMEEWETQYYRWLYDEKKYNYLYGGRVIRFNRPPEQPILYHFKKARVVYKDIDYEKEARRAAETYKKYKRDGRFYDTGVSRSFKKYCARDLRRFNRELARKIVKDDDSWESKPYPDTYLGKKYIWHFW